MTDLDKINAFLDEFFSSPNEISDSQKVSVSAFSELLRERGGTALPYVHHGKTYWYGFGFTDRVAREVCQQLFAFVGPSHSTLTGPASELDPKSPVEGLLLTAASGPTVRFQALDQGEGSGFPDALRLFVSVLRSRPQYRAERTRPRHRISAELELAFAMGNGDRAKELISEFVATGSVSALNHAFLEIRCHQASGEWAQLLSHRSIEEVLKLRRPTLVNGAIAEAIDSVYLESHRQAWLGDDPTGATGAVESFLDVPLEFRAVYDAPLPVQPSSLLTGRALNCAWGGAWDTSAELIDLATGIDERRWLESLLAVTEKDEPKTAPQVELEPDATALFVAGDYGGALETSLNEAPTKQLIDLAFRAAYNLNAIDVAESVLRWAEPDPTALKEALLDRSLRQVEKSLRELATGIDGEIRGLSSWPEWFDSLSHPVTRTNAERVLQHAEEWPLPMGSMEVDRLASAIRSCGNDEEVSALALAGVGRLIGTVPRGGWAGLGGVADAALDLVLYGTEVTEVSDEVGVRLLAQVLAQDATEAKVAERLSEFAARWSSFPTPNRLDWLLDVLDIAVVFGGASDESVELLAIAISAATRWSARIDQAQIMVLKAIANELGEGDAARALPHVQTSDTDADGDPLEALSGRTVGVYTLFPGVAERVAGAIKTRCPEARVATNDDHVATEALVGLAKRADVMLVSFGSAQHAATDAIIGVRGREKIVRALGRGSTGMLRALEAWAATAQVSASIEALGG